MQDEHETKPTNICPPPDAGNAAALRATILQTGLASEPVTAWGLELVVHELEAMERDEFEKTLVEETRGGKTRINRTNMRARLVVLTLRDEDGALIFSPDDAESLGRKSAKQVDRVYEIASRLCGLRPEDEEELLGNDEPTTAGDSASA